MDDISIPVIVDDIKWLPDFSFARCSYFTIEYDTPAPGWELALADIEIPFLMTGLSGVILRPSHEKPFFGTVDEIERLFGLVEEDHSLYVGTADIWIPNTLLQHADVPAGPSLDLTGYTFRIGYSLFLAATTFRIGQLDVEQFKKAALDMPDMLTFNIKEHKAFLRWQKMQVKLAFRGYPKDGRLKLKWKASRHSRGGKGVAENE